MSNPKLDLELFAKLYDFGGLMLYRVSYFDPVSFKVIALDPTFSEAKALENLMREQDAGFAAAVTCELVRFDGAFASSSEPS